MTRNAHGQGGAAAQTISAHNRDSLEVELKRARAFLVGLFLTAAHAGAEPLVLVNHLGYEQDGPKRAVIQGAPGDAVSACSLVNADDGQRSALESARAVGPVARWRDWTYWTVDFSSRTRPGRFRVVCTTPRGEIASSTFEVQRHLLETHTLSDVLFYFKGQRSSGALDEADRRLPLEGGGGAPVDAHGGWYDASGDYGKHLSHLSYSTYFNPQQLSLTAWSLAKTVDLLERRSDPLFRQHLRRLRDEAAWGADYLVRVKVPGGSFYRSVSAPGPAKRPDDRRIGRDARGMNVKTAASESSVVAATGAALDQRAYQSSFRAGGGMAIAALARASVMQLSGEKRGEYRRAAEDAWAFLAAHNPSLTNDGRENIVDDYCALLAATELYNATRQPSYKAAADARAERLLARLQPKPRAYWRADDKDRPFFHPADAGLPVVSLLEYLEIADGPARDRVLAGVRRSLEWELATTAEVANPFGLARQLVQMAKGERDKRFFFPHDTETAPWWQGEDARLASLAFAARLALPHFATDKAFAARLSGYGQDQLNWILGLNPFDASMLEGTGRNNPPYRFFDSFEYSNAPGGIVNGITAGFKDPQGIDFNLPIAETGADHDWRWGEQWLPHTSWYLLAVAAGPAPPPPSAGVIIGYVFARDGLLDPATIPGDKLTHINYAFANIKDGVVVEGFARDTENYQVLAGLRQKFPHLKILVSVGGWTWSGNFSDAALTSESRKKFVNSAVDFVRRHDLDGFDVDWEYPGLPGFGNINRPEDKKNFSTLMSELRVALDKAGAEQKRHYLLTFAAGASQSFLDHSEMDVVQGVVDYVNLMTYDFRGDWDPTTGHHSNLFVHPADDRQMSADRAVRAFLAAGVPARKLVLGVPFYGKAWGQVDTGGATADPLYREGGPPAERVPTRHEQLAAFAKGEAGYVRKWDASAQMPYLWNPQQRILIAYDDPESLRVKSRYIRERGLAGVMFWELYADRTGALLDTLAKELR
jgi:GH18 family chitinase